MPEFAYSDLLPTGADDTPYRLLTAEGVSTVEGPGGRTFLQVEPAALQLLARTAMAISWSPMNAERSASSYSAQHRA